MKSIDTNAKIYIPFDENKLPHDISVDDGNSVQVRILYDDCIYFKKTKKKTKFLLCGGNMEHVNDI